MVLLERRALLVSTLPGYDEEIGRWLWCLEDVRRTLIIGIDWNQPKYTRFEKSMKRQTIGSMLYHIALIEADWLYEEVLVTEWDSEISALFPVGCRAEDGS